MFVILIFGAFRRHITQLWFSAQFLFPHLSLVMPTSRPHVRIPDITQRTLQKENVKTDTEP